MNQKILSITIIAVVAIVVLIGLWLSGAGQTGPLSGDVGPTPTPTENLLPSTLTMAASEYCSKTFNNAFEYTLEGQLLGEEGSSVQGAGRTIELYQWGNYGQGFVWSKVATTTTEEEGSFSFTRSSFAGDTSRYQARFPGDEYYAASVSGEVEQTCLFETHLTLSLDRSTCHPITFEVRGGTLRGTLLAYNGEPLAGKTIEIYGQSDTSSGWTAYPDTQTLEDGSFSSDVDWMNSLHDDFKARFPGDAEYPPSEAFVWDVYC